MGHNILLIDDDRGVLFALKLLIEATGNKVTEFSDGYKALDFLFGSDQTTEIEFVVSDLRMPEISGIDLLVSIKQKIPSLPFILMSAHADQAEQQEAFKKGCNAFLPKPFKPNQLIDSLTRAAFDVSMGQNLIGNK